MTAPTDPATPAATVPAAASPAAAPAAAATPPVPAAPASAQPVQAPTPTPQLAGQPPQQPAPAEPQDDVPDDWPESAKAALRKKNNEAKNLRDRLKAQEPMVTAAQEAERAQMSELQRANADLATLRDQLAARDTDVLKVKYQLTDEDLEFIGDGTFEERSARAEKFAARVQAAGQATAPGGPPSNRPQVNLRPGASPDAPVVEDNSYPASWGFQPPARI
ncbi:hypothetical protein ACXYTP_23440 [Tsukamurella ocularis]